MRTGVTVSATAHLAVILVAIIGLSFPQQLTPDAEQSIAVDLIPVESTANLRAGTEQSKVIDTKTPSIVETNKPATLAQPTGNTQQDQPKPAAADTPTPVPMKNTAPAPAPAPQPQPKPEPAPEPKPQPQPQPTPAPEPKPQPKASSAPAPLSQLATDTSTSPDSAPPTPAPAPPTATLEQKRAELKKQQDAAAKAAQAAIAKAIADADVEQKKADQAKQAAAAAAQAAADAKAAQAKAAQAKQQAQAQQAARVADEISSLINNEKSTGAKTGQGGSPTAGKASGTAAKLTQSEIGALIAQIKKCWTLLPNEIESGQQVRLMVNLNSDGSVNGTPQILQADSSEMGGSIARAAQRAIMQCGPYTLASAKYEDWKQLDVTLITSDQ